MEIPTRYFVVVDLVLIADQNIPRSNWLLATITEIHWSKDNVIRVVKLKTKFGTYSRPAANLCLLEESLAKKWISTLITVRKMKVPEVEPSLGGECFVLNRYKAVYLIKA